MLFISVDLPVVLVPAPLVAVHPGVLVPVIPVELPFVLVPSLPVELPAVLVPLDRVNAVERRVEAGQHSVLAFKGFCLCFQIKVLNLDI